ncbi:MAG TPA: CotH kinase family protein, partial [Ilumatobacteraceae bacterium]|nr:CotH kinase family protein [Ilumatobacteraceae bacterium]
DNASFQAKYQRETDRWIEGDVELRDLIRQLNTLTGDAKREWIYANVDVASVVNLLATVATIQHYDIGHKNFRLIYDEHGMWSALPTDFDLSFGRGWREPGTIVNDIVIVNDNFDAPRGPLFGIFWDDPELSAMVARRARTLAEEMLNPLLVAERVADLGAQIAIDAALDRAVWGTYDTPQTPADATVVMMSDFVKPQYQRMLGVLTETGRVAATTQPDKPAVSVTVDDVSGVVALTNDSADSVDLSLFRIDSIGLVVPGGTVVLPGRSAYFVPTSWGSVSGSFGHASVGYYSGSLTTATDFDLIGPGVTSAQYVSPPTYSPLPGDGRVPPGSHVAISGRPNRSAVVSIVATETAAAGYLQVLACDATPGTTSNLNTDRANQTIAGLAVIRFDANGDACVFNQSATHIVVDLQGYLDDGAIDDVPDQRLIDTRSGARPAAGAQVRIHGEANRSAIVSLIATENRSASYLQVLACGAVPGATSNLNTDRANQIIAG